MILESEWACRPPAANNAVGRASLYRMFRKRGWGSREALRAVRVWFEFTALMDAGRARVDVSAEQESYLDVYGEPEAYVNEYGRRVSASEARKELEERIERYGLWYVGVDIREPPCPHCGNAGQWETLDSTGMVMCDDPANPLDNCCMADLMEAAVRAVKEQDSAGVAPDRE